MDALFRVIVNPELASLTEHLCKLPEADLRYIIFLCDYNDSPFWQLPDEVREKKARQLAYANGEEPIPVEQLQEAMDEYKSLIWDEDKEQLRMLTNKIYKLNKSMADEEDPGKLKTLTASINLLKQEKEQLGRSVQAELENIVIKGKRQLSNIELWQRNRKRKKEYENI